MWLLYVAVLSGIICQLSPQKWEFCSISLPEGYHCNIQYINDLNNNNINDKLNDNIDDNINYVDSDENRKINFKYNNAQNNFGDDNLHNDNIFFNFQ